MALRPCDGHHDHFIDRWGVSTLIQAFLELTLALCVLLCAIISVTTTRLLKSSGLFPLTCASCDIHHQHTACREGNCVHGDDEGGDVRAHPNVASKDLLTSSHQDLPSAPMNIVCEECTLPLYDCACPLNQRSLADNDISRGRRLYPNAAASLSSNKNDPVDYFCSDHTVWATEEDDRAQLKQRRGRSSSSSFENAESSYDGSDDIVVIHGSTVVASAVGCECRRCLGIAGPLSTASRSGSSSSRAVKRKFAKVFPNESRRDLSSCSYCAKPTHVFADSGWLPLGKEREGPADTQKQDGGLLAPTDGSDAQLFGRFAPEDSSVRVSSQESFSYNTRRSSQSSHAGLSRCLEESGSRSKLSIDTDLLGGGSTPEWCLSLADSPALGNREGEEEDQEEEQDEGSTVLHEESPELGVMELREALQDEQEDLAAVYLELEEERNAASSAAHEAMAMITRLQEEKAAIQMEARQYQRMAEEKHQYDQESLGLLQDILLRRDQEVYALEDEVTVYRNKLLTLTTNSLLGGSAKDFCGSPERGSDVLLIERETLLLEGSENWKHRREKRDEKLLEEIKNWLHEANDKVRARERIEEVNVVAEPNPRISAFSNRPLPGIGQKNLLDSFTSAAVDDIQNQRLAIEEFDALDDGAASDECEVTIDGFVRRGEFDPRREEIASGGEPLPHNDIAAGYESFQGMLESLRLEPSLRDEESLKTLRKIEEKFHRRSSQGEVRRSGDELRQIWKNTLRSFESDEQDEREEGAEAALGTEAAAETAGGGEEHRRAENATTITEPASTSESPTDIEIGDADRSIGEKRMSVLEYVWKFEEQLHQLGNNRPLIPGKSGLSTDFLTEAPPELKGESPDLTDSDKSKKSPWARLRKLTSGAHALASAANTNTLSPDVDGDRFIVRGETAQSSERPISTHGTNPQKTLLFEEGGHPDGVHDVYEVQPGPRDPPTEATTPHSGNDRRFTHDVKKYVSSTVNELIPGQFIDSQQIGRREEHYLVDNGRPDFVTGNSVEEHEANGKGRPDLSGRGDSFGLSKLPVKNSAMCRQADGWCGDLADMSLGQSRARAVNESGMQVQGVVQQLTQRLRALEKDRQLMQDTIASLKLENGEVKILQDIALQLRALRGGGGEQTTVSSTEMWPSDDPAVVSSIKGVLSLDSLRHSVKSQLSKVAQLFLGSGDPGGSQEDQQYVGLFRLLHKSPLSKLQKPLERARSLKAAIATQNGQSEPQPQRPSPTLNRLESQPSWPMDTKDRSETAFGGWDP